MNKETIERTAIDYAIERAWRQDEGIMFNIGSCEMQDHLAYAFIAGAEWRINSVWHKAIEESPKPCSLVLVEMLDGNVSLFKVFDGKADMLRWKRWAYVSDLVQ